MRTNWRSLLGTSMPTVAAWLAQADATRRIVMENYDSADEAEQIDALVLELIQKRYVKVIGGEYPVVTLTPLGANALKTRAAALTREHDRLKIERTTILEQVRPDCLILDVAMPDPLRRARAIDLSGIAIRPLVPQPDKLTPDETDYFSRFLFTKDSLRQNLNFNWVLGKPVLRGQQSFPFAINIPRCAELPEGTPAPLLYWVGCAGSFDDRNKKASRAVAKLLQRAGIDFAVLGEGEMTFLELINRLCEPRPDFTLFAGRARRAAFFVLRGAPRVLDVDDVHAALTDQRLAGVDQRSTIRRPECDRLRKLIEVLNQIEK